MYLLGEFERDTKDFEFDFFQLILGLNGNVHTLYQAMFCDPKTSNRYVTGKAPTFHDRAQHTHASAVQHFPERFCLDHIIGMFVAFEAECPVTDLAAIAKPATVFPFYDTKTWYTDIFDKLWRIQGTNYNSTHIKLANDGYLYSPNEDYPTRGKMINLHRKQGFQELDLNDGSIVLAFSPIFKYGAAFLQTAVKHLKIRVLHSFDAERIDVEMINERAKQILFVTFEPGLPQEPYLIDTWQTVDIE